MISNILFQLLEEAAQIDAWLEQQMDILNTRFERNELTLQEGEALLRELEESFHLFDRYHHAILSLIERSRQISPLLKRSEPIQKPIVINALVDYNDPAEQVCL